MSWKKKLGIVIPVCCLAVVVVLCIFWYREPAAPKIIEPPFDNLYWGMTVDEARQVLKDAGIENVAQQGTDDFFNESEIWTLTAEQAELLGYEPYEEAELSTKKFWPVHIGFSGPKGKNGEVRLVMVATVLEVDAANAATSDAKVEFVKEQISKEFGEPLGGRQPCWKLTDNPELSSAPEPSMALLIDVAVGENEIVARYTAYQYVLALYGENCVGIDSQKYM